MKDGGLSGEGVGVFLDEIRTLFAGGFIGTLIFSTFPGGGTATTTPWVVLPPP